MYRTKQHKFKYKSGLEKGEKLKERSSNGLYFGGEVGIKIRIFANINEY